MNDSALDNVRPSMPADGLAGEQGSSWLTSFSGLARAFGRVRRSLRLGWLMFVLDFKNRYQMAYLGYFWFFVGPIVTLIPLIAMGKHFDLGVKTGSNARYEVYALVGALLWQIFWSGVMLPQTTIRRFKQILRAMPVPPEMILVICAFYILLNSSIQLLVLFGTVLVTLPFSYSFLLGVASVPLLMMCGFSLGIFIAPMGLIYRDFRYGMTYISSFFLMMAPIFYAMPKSGYLRVINLCNPVTYLVGIPRGWFIGDVKADSLLFLVSTAVFFALLYVGFKFYQRATAVAMSHM